MKKERIYEIGKKLELTKKEINSIFYNKDVTKEKAVLTMGPYPYNGTHYGTISIKDI